MSTIPTIFNERKVAHTIVGGKIKKSDEETPPMTVILLNRGGRYYRSAVFQNLETAGFTSIISIEMSNEPYDIENLSIRFPSIKFLVPLEKITIGEMINAGVAETDSPYVFVVWNDIRVSPSGVPNRLMARIREEGNLCVAPTFQNSRLESLPVQMVPAVSKKSFQVEPMPCYRDSSPTIYPFDFVGIYSRERFVKLGGFDHTILNPYWQNLDFGFRSHLWSENILVSTAFRLSYDGEIPQEDITTDSSYMKFYLKNIAPVFRSDEAYLPLSRFFSYARRCGTGIFETWNCFRMARKWVKLNRYRFARDAASVTETWEPCVS